MAKGKDKSKRDEKKKPQKTLKEKRKEKKDKKAWEDLHRLLYALKKVAGLFWICFNFTDTWSGIFKIFCMPPF